jgi:hypothetical protein
MTDAPTFSGPQNQSRAIRVVEVLDLIHKSARSQKVGPDEERELLQPVFDKLAKMGWHVGSSPKVPGRVTGLVTPQWVSIREAAQQASLRDLTYAMAVYLSRLDEELNLNLKGK